VANTIAAESPEGFSSVLREETPIFGEATVLLPLVETEMFNAPLMSSPDTVVASLLVDFGAES
jgi:hypothetical protein